MVVWKTNYNSSDVIEEHFEFGLDARTLARIDRVQMNKI